MFTQKEWEIIESSHLQETAAIPAKKISPSVAQVPADSEKSFSQRDSGEMSSPAASSDFAAGIAEEKGFQSGAESPKKTPERVETPERAESQEQRAEKKMAVAVGEGLPSKITDSSEKAIALKRAVEGNASEAEFKKLLANITDLNDLKGAAISATGPSKVGLMLLLSERRTSLENATALKQAVERNVSEAEFKKLLANITDPNDLKDAEISATGPSKVGLMRLLSERRTSFNNATALEQAVERNASEAECQELLANITYPNDLNNAAISATQRSKVGLMRLLLEKYTSLFSTWGEWGYPFIRKKDGWTALMIAVEDNSVGSRGIFDEILKIGPSKNKDRSFDAYLKMEDGNGVSALVLAICKIDLSQQPARYVSRSMAWFLEQAGATLKPDVIAYKKEFLKDKRQWGTLMCQAAQGNDLCVIQLIKYFEQDYSFEKRVGLNSFKATQNLFAAALLATRVLLDRLPCVLIGEGISPELTFPRWKEYHNTIEYLIVHIDLSYCSHADMDEILRMALPRELLYLVKVALKKGREDIVKTIYNALQSVQIPLQSTPGIFNFSSESYLFSLSRKVSRVIDFSKASTPPSPENIRQLKAVLTELAKKSSDGIALLEENQALLELAWSLVFPSSKENPFSSENIRKPAASDGCSIM